MKKIALPLAQIFSSKFNRHPNQKIVLSRNALRYSSESTAANGNRRSTVNEQEIRNLEASSEEWWNPFGQYRALHRYNPVRVNYIREQVVKILGRDGATPRPLEGLTVLDIGCGGGILAEALCRLGGNVIGVDAGEANISAANIRLQSQHSLLGSLSYVHSTAEDLFASGKTFDLVVASEVVEHVDHADLFLECVAKLTKSNGIAFVSTFNKTALSYFLGVCNG